MYIMDNVSEQVVSLRLIPNTIVTKFFVCFEDRTEVYFF